MAAITVNLYDWRDVDDVALPFYIRIDDGERIFDYRYSEVDIASKYPSWFFAAEEVKLLVIEPRGVVNTGDKGGERTATNDVWI